MSDTGRLNEGTCVDVGIDDNMLVVVGLVVVVIFYDGSDISQIGTS